MNQRKIDLDVTENFQAHYVHPGTTYLDEPTVEVDPGWYVVGERAGEEEGHGLILKVEEAWTDAADDAREAVAKRLAEVLRDHFGDAQ